MIRRECLELVAPLITDQLVLTSQSGQRIEWFHISKHEGNLLVGMMGCATGVGMGLALALPHRRVIVLESDGSVLLSLFNLATLGNINVDNLAVFVFDNGVYSGTRISEPTATSGRSDLAAIALLPSRPSSGKGASPRVMPGGNMGRADAYASYVSSGVMCSVLMMRS